MPLTRDFATRSAISFLVGANAIAVIAKSMAFRNASSDSSIRALSLSTFLRAFSASLFSFLLSFASEAARTKTRRHTPVLYRHVPISGGENRAKWLPNGYVSATDDKTLHGWNSVAVILSALALIKYPDSPFYEGPLTDGFWLLKAAQETEVKCTDPLALVAMLEQFNYVVPAIPRRTSTVPSELISVTSMYSPVA